MAEQGPDPETVKRIIDRLKRPETTTSQTPTLSEEDKKVGEQVEKTLEGLSKKTDVQPG